MSDPIEILLLGDLILDVPDPDHWLAGIAPLTRAADLVIGHLEVPHTRRGQELQGDVPAPGADPDHLAALARANIRMLSMAGNHIADCGPEGIADTIAELARLGIAHNGAGADIVSAKAPARIQVSGRSVSLLSYNCVGPELSWAAADRAGSAYVNVLAADGGPSRPQADLVEADPASVASMITDIVAERPRADLLVVALHKGITHRPAAIAPYERALSDAAIEAGADVVVGHHAHIARGIEFHDGKPVFHGLGNGVVVTHALSPGQGHAARAEWVERRKSMFGFEPDPAYALAPFHPEAANGMIGKLLWHANGRIEAGFVPIWFEPPGRPVRPSPHQRTEIKDYIIRISIEAGLAPLIADDQGSWISLK
ncbi:CapA family protein [Sphingomonas sp. BIUV-7]|uniref:CapA family protein n=1 Tax=Sphingomonas natans TaxID=3063330 RepID=A0ABT8YA88_9SPHN|nr:CapA family protein [Sphingomonas sp. BIUV-7]MDO6415241.1 CapA family protein [Sphingomonas sp. BIUV-7]